MCVFKTLHSDENGFVLKCSQCRHFHIGFGNALIACSRDQFLDFSGTVTAYYEAYKDTGCRHEKKILIPTAVRTMMLRYSICELEQLTMVLRFAKASLKKEELSELHAN